MAAITQENNHDATFASEEDQGSQDLLTFHENSFSQIPGKAFYQLEF